MAFVAEHVSPHAIIYTDGSTSYTDAGGRYAYEAVRNSVGEYVRAQAHTNGIESFWSMLKQANMGTFHQMSAKHLYRYVTEFAGRKNIRHQDTITQMERLAVPWTG